MKELTRDEISLLLYLETRAVDNSGKVGIRHMNADDFTIAQDWHNEGFVQFGELDREPRDDGVGVDRLALYDGSR